MQIAPEDQRALLAIARILQNASVELPEISSEEEQQVEQAQRKLDSVRSGAAAARLAVDDMELEVLRIQKEEALLRRRLADDRKTLGATEDIELRRDAKHDIAATQARLRDLTSQIQEAHNELHALRQNVDHYGAKLDAAQAEVERAQRALDAAPEDTRVADEAAHLERLRQQVPAAALAIVEQRFAENGIGAARLRGKICEGCAIALPPATVSRLRSLPADTMPECPDCDSFLVRGE
ncbi:MAG: hypothetical protein Q3976_04270 [Corynebacterium sp.]|nr:hypothetical protein [Corynebacterium sp.]